MSCRGLWHSLTNLPTSHAEVFGTVLLIYREVTQTFVWHSLTNLPISHAEVFGIVLLIYREVTQSLFGTV